MPDLLFEESCSKQAGPNDAKWQRSAVWLLAIRVCSRARMEEREREKEGESKPGRRRSHGRYFTTSASTVRPVLVLLSVEPSRRQKRQANMAQQAKACPLLHFGETKQD